MVNVRTATLEDATAIADIYNVYVLLDTCTFEVEAVSAEDIRQRIAQRLERYGYLVAESADHRIAGFAYYGEFRNRAAYDHVVETSIYLNPKMLGQGIGVALYRCLA